MCIRDSSYQYLKTCTEKDEVVEQIIRDRNDDARPLTFRFVKTCTQCLKQKLLVPTAFAGEVTCQNAHKKKCSLAKYFKDAIPYPIYGHAKKDLRQMFDYNDESCFGDGGSDTQSEEGEALAETEPPEALAEAAEALAETVELTEAAIDWMTMIDLPLEASFFSYEENLQIQRLFTGDHLVGNAKTLSQLDPTHEVFDPQCTNHQRARVVSIEQKDLDMFTVDHCRPTKMFDDLFPQMSKISSSGSGSSSL